MFSEVDLPWTDPYILLSFVNTKLRDEYTSLQSFCENYSCEGIKLNKTLESIGYRYNSNANQFILI